MIRKAIVVLALGIMAACSMVSQDPYARAVEKYRYSRDSFMKFSEQSPLDPKEKMPFIKLNYFPINKDFAVKATYEHLDSPIPYNMENSMGETEQYYKVGALHFTMKGQNLSLNVYQSADFLGNAMYKNELFLPFWDASNGKTSYKGGRFLDVEYQGSDTLTLDFNYTYNPYCAYNHNYTCPVPPSENRLPFAVEAGEKNYGQSVSF